MSAIFDNYKAAKIARRQQKTHVASATLDLVVAECDSTYASASQTEIT